MNNWKIIVRGRVQGVGFRPWIYTLAKSLDVSGSVRNTTEGVEIILRCHKTILDQFVQHLRERHPASAQITSVTCMDTEVFPSKGFVIEESTSGIQPRFAVAPDQATCSSCMSDIHNPDSRHYKYPFTSCSACGPRYSLVKGVPYDREMTTMAEFEMCPGCREEFNNPSDRRFHAQSLSCPDCRIPIRVRNRSADWIERTGSETADIVKNAWSAGELVSVKGIGGYLLTCDALNPDAINQARSRKHRPRKPLAVMAPDLAWVAAHFHLSDAEQTALSGFEAPIVLLDPKSDILPSGINPGLRRVGVFLPYAPLLSILLDEFGGPVVATSANRTGDPICYQDEEDIKQLMLLADLVVSYDREITFPQDDSVLQFSRKSGKLIILRRSRGMAPEYLSGHGASSKQVLALGADLKHTWAFQCDTHIYPGQYIGDMSVYRVQQRSTRTLKQFSEILNATPEAILCDAHPGYFSTRNAEKISRSRQIPLVRIQHHKAHFAAILGEHDLFHTLPDGRILGVIWDGSGYGDDGNIWGGEFMTWDGNRMEHCTQFKPVPVIAGNKMAREPRIAALSHCRSVPHAQTLLMSKFTDEEWRIYETIWQSTDVMTSSVGRLFDALASILQLADHNQYEGEAAIVLQELAEEGSSGEGYRVALSENGCIDTTLFMEQVVSEIIDARDHHAIARDFHQYLVAAIALMADKNKVAGIALSGGVFQNPLLVDMIINALDDRYHLYFHNHLSPNDENIAFGQLMFYNHVWTPRDPEQ